VGYDLVRKVIASDLERRLRLLAMVAADIANDQNPDNIWASLSTLAWRTKKSPRQVSDDLTALVKLGVLVPVTRGLKPRGGGRGRTTRYRFNARALPWRPPLNSKASSGLLGFDANSPNSEPDERSESTREDRETVKPTAENIEPRFDRTTREPPGQEPPRERTAAAPPSPALTRGHLPSVHGASAHCGNPTRRRRYRFGSDASRVPAGTVSRCERGVSRAGEPSHVDETSRHIAQRAVASPSTGEIAHADAKTTSIYLNVTFQQLAESMRRMDSLHDLAPETDQERSPLGNDNSRPNANVVVN